MSEPTTKAGRTFVDALNTMDALDDVARATPVDWAHGVVKVEQEARAALRADLAAKVEALTPETYPDDLELRARVDAVNRMLDRVLALLRDTP